MLNYSEIKTFNCVYLFGIYLDLMATACLICVSLMKLLDSSLSAEQMVNLHISITYSTGENLT